MRRASASYVTICALIPISSQEIGRMERKKTMKEKMMERKEMTQRMPEPFNPFGMMRRFSKDMERLFENFQGFGSPNFFRTDFLPLRGEFENFAWMPQIEVLQNNGQFMVRADLPGLTRDDVKIEVTDNLMTISGERKDENEEKREGFYRSERRYGVFCRQVLLPEGANTENAIATFRNGVLEVSIPVPKLETITRRLEIKEPLQEKSAKATA
jgi:HSP20 family protein